MGGASGQICGADGIVSADMERRGRFPRMQDSGRGERLLAAIASHRVGLCRGFSNLASGSPPSAAVHDDPDNFKDHFGVAKPHEPSKKESDYDKKGEPQPLLSAVLLLEELPLTLSILQLCFEGLFRLSLFRLQLHAARLLPLPFEFDLLFLRLNQFPDVFCGQVIVRRRIEFVHRSGSTCRKGSRIRPRNTRSGRHRDGVRQTKPTGCCHRLIERPEGTVLASCALFELAPT